MNHLILTTGFYGPANASGRFASPRGEIYVGWNRSDSDGGIQLCATIPTGVEMATVRVPAAFSPSAAAPPEKVCATGSEIGAKQVAVNHDNSLQAAPKVVHLECSGGGSISKIDFASYGTIDVSAQPDCGTWGLHGDVNSGPGCHANGSIAVVERLCLHAPRCSITVNNSIFGGDPCPLRTKTLAVRATCTGGVVREPASTFVVKESGVAIWDGSKVVGRNIAGIVSARRTPGGIEVDVLSGHYHFEAERG